MPSNLIVQTLHHNHSLDEDSPSDLPELLEEETPGIPGRVPPGGGGGGRGGGVPLAAAAPQGAPNTNTGDKLIGNPPFVFTGDHSKSEAFMSDWKKY